ncbi:hypothetical protein [Biformimicrobium ophioploci]|uniref:Uncharacterized protein n=1 Tax=Biformimicrobium ophioploci TaxID=3036711 RepID=A0ABQ6LYL9_9GAMM|nr:hypothetical protein [Microbulbifer sp. NKW57]GMG87158.1 hypothetical protein MNKW57_14790 [Microbulbifer sp. NKW57]
MTIGAWTPPSDKKPAKIEREQLQRFIDLLESNQAPALADLLAQEDQQSDFLVRLPGKEWLQEADNWSDGEIWHLIQFFALAEAQLPSWEGGAESAVIPLAKSLRRRKSPLNKEQLMWLKQNSENRFLPYGPL